MKVPGSDIKEAAATNRVQDARHDKVGERKAPATPQASGLVADGASSAAAEDSVQFSALGAILKSELNPSRMAEERRAKIEALKQQISSGTYKPPMEEVAKSLSEEISLEVLLGGGALSEAKQKA